jgi:hypothetical protein
LVCLIKPAMILLWVITYNQPTECLDVRINSLAS